MKLPSCLKTKKIMALTTNWTFFWKSRASSPTRILQRDHQNHQDRFQQQEQLLQLAIQDGIATSNRKGPNTAGYAQPRKRQSISSASTIVAQPHLR